MPAVPVVVDVGTVPKVGQDMEANDANVDRVDGDMLGGLLDQNQRSDPDSYDSSSSDDSSGNMS